MKIPDRKHPDVFLCNFLPVESISKTLSKLYTCSFGTNFSEILNLEFLVKTPAKYFCLDGGKSRFSFGQSNRSIFLGNDINNDMGNKSNTGLLNAS